MGEQSKLAIAVLKSLQEVAILDNLILIGSWCHLFYKHYFKNAPEIPLVRTLDMDLLIPHRQKIRREIDISQLLKQMGFKIRPSVTEGS